MNIQTFKFALETLTFALLYNYFSFIFLFSVIPNLKRKLGGIHVFHEELSLSKHKKYLHNVENWHLPIYELIYVWNFLYMMRKQPQLIEKVVQTVEKYEQTLTFGMFRQSSTFIFTVKRQAYSCSSPSSGWSPSKQTTR